MFCFVHRGLISTGGCSTTTPPPPPPPPKASFILIFIFSSFFPARKVGGGVRSRSPHFNYYQAWFVRRTTPVARFSCTGPWLYLSIPVRLPIYLDANLALGVDHIKKESYLLSHVEPGNFSSGQLAKDVNLPAVGVER